MVEIEQNNNDWYDIRHQPNFYSGAHTIRPSVLPALFNHVQQHYCWRPLQTIRKKVSAYFLNYVEGCNAIL